MMVKKHMIGLFLHNGEAYVRIKKSTTLTLSMNPEEVEYDYIADEVPTTELDKYKPSIDQDLTMYDTEDDYKMVWPYFYERKVGQDAHTNCLIVFMHEKVDDGYKAWLTDSTISVQDLNGVDSKLNTKIIFGGNIQTGTAKVVDGDVTFTADE